MVNSPWFYNKALKYTHYFKRLQTTIKADLKFRKDGRSLSSLSHAEKVKVSEFPSQDIARDKFKIGCEVSGFKVNQVETVPEFQLTAIRLEHLLTGADYLHIAREDPNNVFCVGFRTTPMDSTGVPHILEHSVLCGSDKYPCRDPFFKMLNRSLSTFMNAMTGSDYTIYPFATQNPADYRNLLGVYLDAVFKPNLRELDFLQEGWRLEHKDVMNKSSPIIIKGVVFNEMKGVFADAQQLFVQKLQNGILPYHTYGFISGGDPLSIPDLTWQNLKDFHYRHYHPSNSRFFTYGDQPLENHLAFINDNYLSKFKKIDPNTSVPEEPRWSEPRKDHISCGVDPLVGEEHQTSVAISYLLSSITDDFENFTLAIIGELLTSGPNSPFYKSLIESELGTNFSPGTGVDSHTRTTTFAVGVQGMHNNKIDEVIYAIDRTFEKIIGEGFTDERIEGVLHSIELGLKHQTSSFGIRLAMSLTPSWNHDVDPINSLKINSKIEKFRKAIQDNPNFIKEKVEQYFKNNKHKFILSMSPDKQYEHSLLQAEKQVIKEKVNKLSNDDKDMIWNLGNSLKAKQEAKDDVSCLPSLQVSDIPRIAPHTPVVDLDLRGIPVQMCKQPTNGVSYLNIFLSTKDLPEELTELLPLFCGVLTEMGAGDLDFRSFTQKMELVSGGLSSDIHITDHPLNPNIYEGGVLLSSYSLEKNFVPMLDLWSKVFNEVRLDDVARFNTLVKIIASEKANSLVYNGHNYAMTSASSSTNFVSQMKEKWEGLTQIQKLKEISDNCDLNEVLKSMQQIASHLLHKRQLRIAINSSHEKSDDHVSQVEKFLERLRGEHGNESSFRNVPQSFTPFTCRTHHVFPFPVNFAAKSFPCMPYLHPDSGPLRVLARLMFQFLHREIREKGGAYGGGAVATPGHPFCFFSYRDPHSTQTLKTFDDAVEWVLSGNFTSQDVNEAKLGVFQKIDAPVAPGSKGMQRFLSHISDDMFNEHRNAVLDADSQDIIKVCRIYLREANFEGACLIGPPNEFLHNDPFWECISH